MLTLIRYFTIAFCTNGILSMLMEFFVLIRADFVNILDGSIP